MPNTSGVRKFGVFHDEHHAWETICHCVGQRISSLYRVIDYNFLTGEMRQENDAELQINFSDGQVLLLYGGTAGQALKAGNTSWQDPFAGKDEAFQVFLNDYHGWWAKLVDVSGEEHYRDVVGGVIEAACPIVTAEVVNWLSGVQFVIDDIQLNFIFVWDECQLLWGNSQSIFEERRVAVDYKQGCKADNTPSQEKA